MSRPYISAATRLHVRERDYFCCAYCKTQSKVVADELEVEHITPLSKGGGSDVSNLCLACPRCNASKGMKTDAVDPESGKQVMLFNPREDQWDTHFTWSEDKVSVIGKTAIGRATIETLRMNAYIAQVARKKWVAVGWHPPTFE